MRITLDQYLAGRDALYPGEFTDEIRKNALLTVSRVNNLLAVLEAERIPLESNPRTGNIINSGWRPAQINGQVKGAAPKSKHITAEACDLYDPEGAIDDFLASDAGQRALVAARLWLEHPAATKGWSHWQVVPPRSQNRIFYP